MSFLASNHYTLFYPDTFFNASWYIIVLYWYIPPHPPTVYLPLLKYQL